MTIDTLILVVLLVITVVILAEVSYLTFFRYLPKRKNMRKIYIDTSALIDGRVLGILQTGFLVGEIVILKSVLRELQLLADSKESDRRSRARSGLQTVSELERMENIDVQVVDDSPELHVEVDEELLKYAKESGGAILSMDYNLLKVAEAEKIQALNINDLALAVKIDFKSGERVKIKLTEKGSNKGQAVGHLKNGTMVVVENAEDKIGQEVMVTLAKFHESSTGKIIFARIARKRKKAEERE